MASKKVYVPIWALMPGESIHGRLLSAENPMSVDLSREATITVWNQRTNDLAPGSVRKLPAGTTVRIYVRGDLRYLMSEEGNRVFIRCGPRVIKGEEIVFQRFNIARKLVPLASTETEGEDLCDPSGGYHGAH